MHDVLIFISCRGGERISFQLVRVATVGNLTEHMLPPNFNPGT